MINSNPKIEYSDRFFFDEWEYCVTLNFNGASIYRGIHLPQVTLDTVTDIAARQRYYHNIFESNFTGDLEISSSDARHNSRLRTTLFNLLKSLTSSKVVAHYSSLRIYSNDISFIKEIPSIISQKIKQIIINRPFNSIIKKNSVYNYRLKFRYSKSTADNIDNIRKFVENYSDSVSPSRTLRHFTVGRQNLALFSSSHFFIDFNDKKLMMMFNIMAPGVKTTIYDILTEPTK